MIQVNTTPGTKPRLGPVVGIDWINLVAVGTLALSAGAMCILLFAL